jgi:homoserine dehydrogenase
VHLEDIRFGAELGYTMKLLAIAEQTPVGLSLRVQPSFVHDEDPLAKVDGAFNAVSIYGDAVGHVLLYGPGAGMMPTASAVVADIIEVAMGNAARLFAATAGLGRKAQPAVLCPQDDVESRFYLRLLVEDHAGVFAQIGQVLGDNCISISGLLQHESESTDCVAVVITTHLARQGDMDVAIKALAGLEVVRGTPVCIHVVSPPKA